jgi:excisionase family DNA binding protein
MSDAAEQPVGRSVEPLWTVQEVSVHLGIPVDTLYGWRSRKIGPRAYKVGRHLRYDPVEVRQWMDDTLNEWLKRDRLT